MRNVVLGSFVGFVLAAAFLAACGSGGTDGAPGPLPISTPSAVKWTPLGARQSIVTGVNLARDVVWRGSAIYDNAQAGARHQYAVVDLGLNVESFAAGAASVDVGILPAADGSFFATDPVWLGTVEVATEDNRRAVLANVRIPPLRFQFALRLRYAASATARIVALGITPYDEELQ
jgi:hypothetical protein